MRLIIYILLFLSGALAPHAGVCNDDTGKKQLPLRKDNPAIDQLNIKALKCMFQKKADSVDYFTALAYRESIRQQYDYGKTVSLLMQTWAAIAFNKDRSLSDSLLRVSTESFEKMRADEGLKELFERIIFSAHSQGRFDEATDIARKVYELYKRDGNSEKMLDLLRALCAIYKDAGNYERSLHYLQEFKLVAMRTGDPFWIQSTLFSQGELFMVIKDYASALENFRRAFRMDDCYLEEKRMQKGFDTWVKMEYAEIFGHLNQFDSAWHFANLYKPVYEHDPGFRVYLMSTGQLYFLQQQYDKALANFMHGLQLQQEVNDRNEIQRTLVFIAQTHQALQNDSAAIKYALLAYELGVETKSKQIIRDVYQIKYMVYDHWNKPDNANFYFRQYSFIKDSIADDQFRASLAAAHYRQKLDLLDREKLLQQQQLEQSSQKQKFLVFGIVVFLILAFLLFRSILLKRKNEANRLKIAESELLLQKLETEKAKAELQTQAGELEMQALRAQMNPHFVFNSLNSINRFILQNDRLQASEYLTKFSRLIRLILQNSQSPLIPLENELESLRLYLELESLRFDNYFKFSLKVDPDIDAESIKVPPLIIQPFTENAIWHGLMHKEESGTLTVEIYRDDKMLYCRITDDGIGRKKAGEIKSKSGLAHKSMGMRLTAERIAIMDKTNGANNVQITDLVHPDGSAAGTEVLIKLPIRTDRNGWHTL